jgi:P-type conjugative transfer protein TrbG
MKGLAKVSFLSAVILCLAACSSTTVRQPTQSVGKMPLDKNANYGAVQNQAQVRVQVVKEYVPVPIPGQLMPTPGAVSSPGTNPDGTEHKFLTKEAAVKYANDQALKNPQSDDFFNSMMTYDYMPGSLYTIYSAPMKISDIVFQQGEKIISIAAGDTLRWQISQTYSGQGNTLEQHVLVKPNTSGLQNTVVVTTSKRVYHLVLTSTADDTYMVSVSWRYPKDMVQFASDASEDGSGASVDASSAGNTGGSPYQLDLGRLDFNYKFGLAAGNKPDWYPARVFNDGRQTFIEFPPSILSSNAPLPMLFVADNNNQYGTMYNWRQKGRYMVIDAVIQKARLQTGVKSDDKTVVQIEYSQAQ